MTVIRNDFDTIRILGVSFAGAFFVAAFILFVTAWFFSMQHEDDARKATKPLSLQKYQAAEATKLGSYGWVDQQAGKVRIPIDVAKKAVVSQMR